MQKAMIRVALKFGFWLSDLEQLSLGPSDTQFVLNIGPFYFYDCVSPPAERKKKKCFLLCKGVVLLI